VSENGGHHAAEYSARAFLFSALQTGAADSTLAIRDVTVIPMTDAAPIAHATVVRGDCIAAVVLRGGLYDHAGVKKILAEVERAPDLRANDWGRTRVPR
jgi:hypothetical protein